MRLAILFLLTALSVTMAQPKQQQTHLTAAKTFQCVIDEPLNPSVTSLKCAVDSDQTAIYLDVPRTEYRFHNCKTVNLIKDSEGHLQIAEVQPKQCVVERAHKCTDVELSDTYPRRPLQGSMPCKRE